MSEKKVVDNVVKMEWDAPKALYTKGGKLGRTFVVAGHDYETSVGTVTVFFNCYTAFLWVSDVNTEDEDRWNAKELKDWLKENLDEAFPLNYNEYVPVINYGSDEVNQEIIDKYDLGDYVDDIIARLNDVKPYSEEKNVNF